MGNLLLHPPVGAPIVVDKDEASVGRDPGNDVVVPEGSVSRRHARLVRRESGWAVVDLGSANGTFIDSTRVSDALLKTGQELRFGGMPYKVEIEGEPAAAAAPAPEHGADVTVMQSSPVAPPPHAAPPPPAPVTAAYAVPPAPRVAHAPPKAAPLPPAPPAPARFGPAAAAPPLPAHAPAKKGRGPLFWIGLGCGGCLTMVAGFAALLAGGFYYVTRGPLEAVSDHVARIRAGDLAGAYAQLSEEHRARVSQEEFQALVEAHTTLKDNAEVGAWPPAGSFRRVNDRAVVRARIVAKSGLSETLVCELVQEGGAWRIASLAVEPGS